MLKAKSSGEDPRATGGCLVSNLPYTRANKTKQHIATTNHFVRFHKDESDGIICKLDSTEYARSFDS